MADSMRIPYLDALAVLERRRQDEIVVTTMTCSRVWTYLSEHPELDVSFGGCMGKASSLGLGLALGRPDRRVWVLDGDGSLVMNLGSLVTIAQQGPRQPPARAPGKTASTRSRGGQPVPGAGLADLAGMARAAGYRSAYRFDTLAALEASLDDVLAAPGPTFVTLVVDPAGAAPRKAYPPTRQALAALRDRLAAA